MRNGIYQVSTVTQALEKKITEMGIFKIKMPSVKRFNGEKAKFKEFLT